MYEEIEIRDTDDGYEAVLLRADGEDRVTTTGESPGEALREIADLLDEVAKYS